VVEQRLGIDIAEARALEEEMTGALSCL